MNIFVANLPYSAQEHELKSAFEQYGEVESAKIITDRETNRSRGFGFVEMPNDDEARAAIDGLNEADFGGRPLKVNEAKPKEPRSQGYGRR